ncbi:hypothetical protein DRQ50_09325 [bacterium]|nr:MAG: hypothetical protein DRQ50_09325 [bacterium]
MSNKRMTACSAVTLAIGLVLVAGLSVTAVPAHAQGEPYVELLRQDLRTDKVAVMTEAMAMTPEQAEKFWPIYRDYQAELSKIGDERITLIKYYAEHFESMTDEKAGDMVKNWFGQKKDQLSLLQKTAKKIAKETDSVVAARFIQVENILNMVVDLQIAAELPIFEHGTVEQESAE